LVKGSSVDSGSEVRRDDSSSIASSLLLRLKVQDPEAWKRLVRWYGPVIYSWCRRQGLHADDAEDVGQEVFQAVSRNIGNFRRERPGETFRGWLWTITVNKVRDHRRRRGGQPEAAGGSTAQQQLLQVPEEASEVSAASAPAGEASVLSHAALDLIRAEFEVRTWQAFWRVTVEEQAAGVVAADLGMSLGAVYVAKSRVLRRLREELGDLLD
jgi:RNA polymerase sigma-70 factor (ECF subfamily)